MGGLRFIHCEFDNEKQITYEFSLGDSPILIEVQISQQIGPSRLSFRRKNKTDTTLN